MDFLLIALLTLINGVFAMSELALASSRKPRLETMAEGGDLGARSALKLLERPTTFLSTVQVGITSIGILNGIVGEAAFSDDVAAWLRDLGMPPRASSLTATGIVVACITYVTIIFGELVPKRIGQLYPETVARWVSPPMAWLATAAKPFVFLLSATTHGVLRLLRIDTTAERGVTEEEITASLEGGVDAGVIEQHERQMVQNVFHLDDRPLTSMMLARTDIDWLDAADSVEQALARVARGDTHSWYPVCRGSLDDVVGIVSVARLLALGASASGALESHALPATFVPETLSGMELLEQFREKSSRIVFVVDEYGVVQGLMTPQDLLEAITGELKPGVAADGWATRRKDGSWLLDGLMPVVELRQRLGMDSLPFEDAGRYNTVAGLLMSLMGHLPAVGEHVDCAGWRFEVMDLDGKRIDKVMAAALPQEGDAAAREE